VVSVRFPRAPRLLGPFAMASLVRAVVLYAALAAGAAPSAKSLKSDISILINNDLQGKWDYALSPHAGRKR